jgi:hypothetical protein
MNNNGTFLMEDSQTDLCWNKFTEDTEKPLDKGLLIAVVCICSLILLMGVACLVLCILKIKYRYQILKMDFLFRRQKGQETGGNYYTVNNRVETFVLVNFMTNQSILETNGSLV